MLKAKPSNTGVSERVADFIKEQIRSNVYPVGTKISSEREMADILQVSRNTVREAYKILEAYGYLRTEHGRGVFVCSEADQIKKMTKSFFLSKNQISDLFDVRIALEVNIAEWAACYGSKSQQVKLLKIVSNAEEVINKNQNINELSKYDSQFHLCLAEMSNNMVAYQTMNHLVDLLTQSRAHSIQISGRAAKSVSEHQQIAAAIVARDVNEARKLIENHIVTVKDAIIANLEINK